MSGKQGELVSPLHVNDGGPQVLEVEQVYAVHFVDSHVAVPALGHDSGSAGLEARASGVLHQGRAGHADVNRVHGPARDHLRKDKKDVPLLSRVQKVETRCSYEIKVNVHGSSQERGRLKAKFTNVHLGMVAGEERRRVETGDKETWVRVFLSS